VASLIFGSFYFDILILHSNFIFLLFFFPFSHSASPFFSFRVLERCCAVTYDNRLNSTLIICHVIELSIPATEWCEEENEKNITLPFSDRPPDGSSEFAL
jgi:hypothetical protein